MPQRAWTLHEVLLLLILIVLVVALIWGWDLSA